MKKHPSRLGAYLESSVTGEVVRAFIPPPLPPEPPVELGNLQIELERANQAVGRLDGLTSVLPDVSFFIYMYVRKEAVLSSQIEGTQSSLSDLLIHDGSELPGVPLNDIREVSNYVAAIDHGLRRLQEDFPLSLRLIREIHEVLLSNGRGSELTPGEFRRSQNWIGGTRPGNARFVPPPPERLMECLDPFEKFLHSEQPPLPVLVKVALVHVQFETIHPFLDGNGRLGRLLITLLLCASGVLREPILYLSLYFKTNRATYYELLNRVRAEGDWESWVKFFLQGVAETAEQATKTVHELLAMLAEDRRRIEELGRPAASVLRVHELLRTAPVLSIPVAARKLGVSPPTVRKAVRHLEDLGIVRESTGKQRWRLFVYERYVAVLNRGTELER